MSKFPERRGGGVIKLTNAKIQREKALLAIIFAGYALNQPLQASCEDSLKSSDFVVKKFANNTKVTAQDKAFYLLLFAHSCLTERDTGKVEADYGRIADQFDVRFSPFTGRSSETVLTDWASRVASEEHCKFSKNISGTAADTYRSSTTADLALKGAVVQIEKVNDGFIKWNLYFIASKLFRMSGNLEGYERCSNLVETFFNACEVSATADVQEITAAVSILNSAAYGIVPLHIPNLNPAENEWQKKTALKPCTNEEFRQSEKLRIRAAQLADRLPASDHIRRKAHRDLALWYTELGKREKGENEQQILFELVGRKDKRILYPHHGTCGHLVWWVEPRPETYMGCGMG